jgi:hypothetical protein
LPLAHSEKEGNPKAAGLQTRHVFLDTEVYRQYAHNLNIPPLQSFLALIKDHVFTLHITDITKSEIERQIRELATEVAQKMNKANRGLRLWRSRSRWRPAADDDIQDVDASTLATQGIRDFQMAMSMDWHPQEHLALGLSATSIFRRYFAREAPFDHADSKEFPDAFVVEVLDQWCKNQSALMYVVTRDRAMQRAANRTSTLLALSSLDELLQIVAEAQSPDIVQRAEHMLESPAVWDKLEESVRDQIGHLVVIYTGDLFDGEAIEHFVGNEPVELASFHVLSVSLDVIGVLAKLKVPLTVEVQYQDTSDAFYDKEDGTYIGGETAVAEIESDVTISVFLMIDPRSQDVLEIEILTQEVRVSEPYETYK